MRTGNTPLALYSSQAPNKGPGTKYQESDCLANTLFADAGKATQTTTLAVSTNSNGHEYTFAINSIQLTATGGSTATLTGDAIVAAIEADALANAAVSAVNSSGTVTLTSRSQNQAFNVSTGDSYLTVTAGTAQSYGSDIDMGAGIIVVPSGAAQAAASSLVARAVVLTPTNVNSTLYQVAITMNPGCGNAEVTYNASYTSDGSATVKEIVEGLTASVNGVMPANTVIATEDDATMTLTAEVAGIDFIISYNANIAVGAYSGTTLASTFRGIAAADDTSIVLNASSNTTRKILGGSAFACYTTGRSIVETDAVPVPANGNPVCVRVSGTGALFSPNASSTHLPLPLRLARWFQATDVQSSSRGVVQLGVQ